MECAPSFCCWLCKQEKLLLYWKGLQSSHTILGQLSRAFQLDGLVGIAMESVIAGARMECAASFCGVVHPHIGILAIVAYTSNHGLNIGNNSLLKPDSDFPSLGKRL